MNAKMKHHIIRIIKQLIFLHKIELKALEYEDKTGIVASTGSQLMNTLEELLRQLEFDNIE